VVVEEIVVALQEMVELGKVTPAEELRSQNACALVGSLYNISKSMLQEHGEVYKPHIFGLSWSETRSR
jgi:hypothetical protein